MLRCAAIAARLSVSAAISASDRLLRACGRLRVSTAMLSMSSRSSGVVRTGAFMARNLDPAVARGKAERTSTAGVCNQGRTFKRGAVMARTAAKKSARKKSGSKKPDARRKTAKAARGGRRWSRRVTQTSDALDLQGGVFTLRDPKKIAASLKRSAERSKRRKANPYRSALSMLTFYINRAGKNLPASRRKVLDRTKDELKAQFGKD